MNTFFGDEESQEVKEDDKVSFSYPFDPEIEDKIKYYLGLTKDIPVFPLNNKKYKRTKIPHFQNEYEKKEWEREEIRRCKQGHDGMCGKMYFWFNYCWIKNIKGGRIAPQYRVCDEYWFKEIESCRTVHLGQGIVCVKRRRGGFSWKEAADIIHDASFFAHTTIGVNSKSERDTIILFNKVKFIYDNVPSFLRASSEGGKTKMSMFFGFKAKDQYGNSIMRGTQSEIACVPPTDSAYEGMMLHKWICDEAGKISNLLAMWSYTEDCLMQETQRVGTPIIFGTSGEIGKTGDGLMELWFKSHLYGLRRFFFAGWMGLAVDEFGNDRKEECIRHILHQRKIKAQLSAKMYNEYLQKYPLTPEEAFMQLSAGGVGDVVRINAQRVSLLENPPLRRTGFFKYDGDDIVFVPSPTGACIIYEHPEGSYKDLYIAGCDPSDHDDVTKEASDLSLYILKKRNGLSGPKIVFEYTDRPQKAQEFYEQALMALIYYNAKVLIERNRFRMISFFEESGYKHLLVPEPASYMKRSSMLSRERMGIHMGPNEKLYLKDLITEYVDHYCDIIPSVELLDEFLIFGAKNTDKAMAFGLCLIYEKEDKKLAKKREEIKQHIPRFRFKNVNGSIVRVTDPK